MAVKPTPNYGLLTKLFKPGQTCSKWTGPGVSLIQLPNHTGFNSPKPRVLIHQTTEAWQFDQGGIVPNRTLRMPASGSSPDQFSSAVRYLQVVNSTSGIIDGLPVVDPTMLGMIHQEPGFLIHAPQTNYADKGPSDGPEGQPAFDIEQYVRLGTIPHGAAIMLSTAVNGATALPTPTLPEYGTDGIHGLDASPLTGGPHAMKTILGYFENVPRTTEPNHPAMVLKAQLAELLGTATVASRSVIHMGTRLATDVIPPVNRNAFEAANTMFQARPGSYPSPIAGNVPVPTENSKTTNVEFWFNFISTSDGREVIQYAQNIMLDFGGIQWPHITGATLTQSGR